MREKRLKFGPAAKIYAFTTENLAGYLPALVSSGGRVLTVCGSGDHLINAALFGATAITAFDLNQNALHWTRLKLVALSQLSLAQFKRFLMLHSPGASTLNRHALDYRLYRRRIRSRLPSSSRGYFDCLYARYEFDGAKLRQSEVFNNLHDRNALKIASNPYLHSSLKYQRARRQLKVCRIKLAQLDLRLVAKKVRGQFDLILLSNIADYTQLLFPGQRWHLLSFFSKIIAALSLRLKPPGLVCAAYLYALQPDRALVAHNQIDHPKLREQACAAAGLKMAELRFRGVVKGKEDAVVIVAERAGGNHADARGTLFSAH